MLRVSHLSRQYDTFKAVDDVSFKINKGEIVGLLGHNGAGKTTIMKMLSGFIEPDAGEVLVDGLSLSDNTHTIQKMLGYLPENLPVYPDMIVADYLDYAADLKGLKNHVKTAELKRVIRATQLQAKLLAPIATLSRGFKQRVGVAQAMLGSPGILILDEPTNGLDPVQTEQMRNLLRDIAKDATVILSTHIMQEVEALCDRVLIMSSGKLVIDSTLDALKGSQQIQLVSSIKPENTELVTKIYASITRFQHQKSEQDRHHYLLDIDGKTDINILMQKLNRHLIITGNEVMSIATLKRDLETVFREVCRPDYQVTGDKSQEVKHAA